MLKSLFAFYFKLIINKNFKIIFINFTIKFAKIKIKVIKIISNCCFEFSIFFNFCDKTVLIFSLFVILVKLFYLNIGKLIFINC